MSLGKVAVPPTTFPCSLSLDRVVVPPTTLPFSNLLSSIFYFLFPLHRYDGLSTWVSLRGSAVPPTAPSSSAHTTAFQWFRFSNMWLFPSKCYFLPNNYITAFTWFYHTFYMCNNSPICFYFALIRLSLHKNSLKPRHTYYIYMVLPYIRQHYTVH